MHFRVPDENIISAATEQKANSVELWMGETYIGKVEPTDTGIRLESDYIVSNEMLVVIEAVEPTALQINLRMPAKAKKSDTAK